jgi:hypothetical protein
MNLLKYMWYIKKKSDLIEVDSRMAVTRGLGELR